GIILKLLPDVSGHQIQPSRMIRVSRLNEHGRGVRREGACPSFELDITDGRVAVSPGEELIDIRLALHVNLQAAGDQRIFGAVRPDLQSQLNTEPLCQPPDKLPILDHAWRLFENGRG